jgi:hypothetical protein
MAALGVMGVANATQINSFWKLQPAQNTRQLPCSSQEFMTDGFGP